MPDIKRQTAYKCSISQILNNKYIQQQGWEPNYIEVNDNRVSRVNLIATLVQKEGNTLTIDDGTGQIQIMLFSEEDMAKDRQPGEVILIIGRPREYNNKRYIVPEIIRKIEDNKWILHRKKELNITRPEQKIIKQKETQNQPKIQNRPEETAPKTEQPKAQNHSSIIIQTIRELDTGDGADIAEVIKKSEIKGAAKYIENLINEGEIFEIRAGKVKILE